MPKVTLICKVCNKSFETFQSPGRRKRVCCSRACKARLAPKGEDSYHWKGGRIIRKNGYAAIRFNGRYVYEHRHVMEQRLGRSLHRNETVHHLNGNKLDNRIENLHLVDKREHDRMETQDGWASGKRVHRSHNVHLRTGQTLICPLCGTEHYEKLSRLGRPFAQFCPSHRFRGMKQHHVTSPRLL